MNSQKVKTDSNTAPINAQPHQLLAKYRWRAGLTQMQLAARLGLKSDRMLRSWESGASLPRAARLRQLLEIYLTLGVFTLGRVMEEATELWRAVQQAANTSSKSGGSFPHFDAAWLAPLLAGGLTIKNSQLPGTRPRAAGSRHNLPASLTSFIGRTEKLAELQELLQFQRLVTLTGPGGSGKTRLALEAAADQYSHFENTGGVWLVELAALTRSEFVVEHAAKVLSISETPGRSLEDNLMAFLQPQTLLLVLDNCEHLLAECARLTERLLAGCSSLKVLATSREPLNLSGEWVVRVPSLSLPGSGENSTAATIIEYEAVRLFVERARAAEPNFVLTEINAGAVVEICTRLDGIPLALELAAARLRGMGAAQLAARLAATLDTRFRLLAGGNPVALPRQQTLLALIEWSYNLLKEREQVVFQRSGVFAGDWELEAAETVCAGDFQTLSSWGNIRPEEVTEVLVQLVNKSLLQLDQINGRYSMLETVRLFARQKLEESGALDDLNRRHLEWFLWLAEDGLSHSGTLAQPAWFERLATEQANFRSALSWAIRQGRAEEAARLALALWNFWHYRIYQAEAVNWLEQIIALPACVSLPLPLQARLYSALGELCGSVWQPDKARRYQQAALKLWRETGDLAGIAGALLAIGWECFAEIDLEGGRSYARQTLDLAREIGEKKLLAAALRLYCACSVEAGQVEGMKPLVEESLAIWRELGDRKNIASALDVLTRYHEKTGGLEEAGRLVLVTVGMRVEFDDYLGLIGSVVNLLHLAWQVVSQPVGAGWVAQLLGVIAHWEASIGGSRRSPWHTHADDMSRQAAAVLGQEAYDREYAAGQSLSLTQIAALAAEITRPRPANPDSDQRVTASFQNGPVGGEAVSSGLPGRPYGLSRREAEVLRLVAAGRSNLEIARELVISPRTVDAHLRSIFAKTEVTSRHTATLLAIEHGLA